MFSRTSESGKPPDGLLAIYCKSVGVWKEREFRFISRRTQARADYTCEARRRSTTLFCKSELEQESTQVHNNARYLELQAQNTNASMCRVYRCRLACIWLFSVSGKGCAVDCADGRIVRRTTESNARTSRSNVKSKVGDGLLLEGKVFVLEEPRVLWYCKSAIATLDDSRYERKVLCELLSRESRLLMCCRVGCVELSSPVCVWRSWRTFLKAEPPPTATVIANAKPVTSSSLRKTRNNAWIPFARVFEDVMKVISGGLRLRKTASAYVLIDICNGWSLGYLCR